MLNLTHLEKVTFDPDHPFWILYKKTIKGSPVYLHMETGFVLTCNKNPKLFGIKSKKGVFQLNTTKSLEDFENEINWAKDCGIPIYLDEE